MGDLVFRRRETRKVGSSKKLNTICMGPLVVVEVINPVLYRVRDHKREYVLHHDLLKCCEDRVVPLWLRKLRHELMDLDTTIAYDQAEQEDEIISENAELMDGTGEEEVEEDVHLSQGGSSSGKSIGGCSKDVSPGPKATSGGDLGGCPKDANPGTASTSETMGGTHLGGGTPEQDVDPVNTQTAPDAQDWNQAEGTPMRVSWIDGTTDLGLKSLFSETPVVHIYAKQGNSGEKGKGKKGYSPVESTSRAGRQRKVPAHLQDYKY